MTSRFVVLGLAGARAQWFATTATWSHAGSIPIEFVKCVSPEQLRTRLVSGRAHSAALLDGTLPGVDRDLIDAVHAVGAAVLVVERDRPTEYWERLGADGVLRPDFDPVGLTDALRLHAAMVRGGEWSRQSPPEVDAATSGTIVAMCGSGGTGVSTLAMALAQQLAADQGTGRGVVLVDLRREAEQGVLHDAGEVGPGVQELVDLCRTNTPDAAQTRTYTFAVTERRYALLLGLRQSTAWSTLRPRAVTVALGALQRTFGAVVCDCDADLEGQADGGSIDVEERNALSRTAVKSADVVFAIGNAGLKGVYSLSRVLTDLLDAGAPPARIVPVFNRAGHSPRQRARAAAALAELLPHPAREEMAAALFVPVRDVEAALHDRRPLPTTLGDPLVGALRAAGRAGGHAIDAAAPEIRQVRPGELGAFAEELAAP